MATHVLNKARDATWTINRSGDTWILGEKGEISGDDIKGIMAPTTIYAATVRIDGKIDVKEVNSLNGYGVELGSAKGKIIVSEKAHVSGTYTALGYYNGSGEARIDNSGALKGGYGMDVTAAKADIRNDGRILATYVGINGNIDDDATIVNSGIIKAENGIVLGTSGASRVFHIVNSGRITASDDAIRINDAALLLNNSGVLSSAISMAQYDDTVTNRGGTINGTILGRGGNDVFNMAGGKLNGVLYGGNGSDAVTLSSLATVYVEAANEGFDTVRINGSYQLGGNIENLVLLGKGNHIGIGNSLVNVMAGNRGDNALYGQGGDDTLNGGAGNDRLFGGADGDELNGGAGRDILNGGEDSDWLDGGSGNDTLTGGGGNDTFFFQAGNGRDTITDFEAGADVIDLRYYDFTDFNDLDGMIAEVGADVVITFSNVDQLIIRNVTINDIMGDFTF